MWCDELLATLEGGFCKRDAEAAEREFLVVLGNSSHCSCLLRQFGVHVKTKPWVDGGSTVCTWENG